jgi:hypothetical protein
MYYTERDKVENTKNSYVPTVIFKGEFNPKKMYFYKTEKVNIRILLAEYVGFSDEKYYKFEKE